MDIVQSKVRCIIAIKKFSGLDTDTPQSDYLLRQYICLFSSMLHHSPYLTKTPFMIPMDRVS